MERTGTIGERTLGADAVDLLSQLIRINTVNPPGNEAPEVAAAAHLARSGWRPERGELKVIVTADEEMGARLGAEWLCETHPDKAYADLVINEGGGAMFEYEGRRFYG